MDHSRLSIKDQKYYYNGQLYSGFSIFFDQGRWKNCFELRDGVVIDNNSDLLSRVFHFDVFCQSLVNFDFLEMDDWVNECGVCFEGQNYTGLAIEFEDDGRFDRIAGYVNGGLFEEVCAYDASGEIYKLTVCVNDVRFLYWDQLIEPCGHKNISYFTLDGKENFSITGRGYNGSERITRISIKGFIFDKLDTS